MILRASRSTAVPSVGVAVLLLSIAAPSAGCAEEPSDATPIGALKLFLDAMERSAEDEGALEEAYRLLDAKARANLEARADEARALAAGKELAPWQMLAQGRFRLRFAPARRGGFREVTHGGRSTVTVRGSSPEERAEVPMVKEGEAWRVALELPNPRSDVAP